MGNCYRMGNGVTQDYAETVRLYKLAADQGFTDAESNLGVAYATGRGVERDLAVAEATRWLERAAAKGHEVAIRNLART